ncbi:MAG: HAD family phosphatase [Clostridia bacterium]|nr:HAD family phosphatase [Clostridia bacterium]
MNQKLKQLINKMEYAIFDLDGTILDSMPIWVNLGETVLKSLGIIPDDDLNKRFKTMTLQQSSEYLTRHFPLDITADELFQIFMENVRIGYEKDAPLKPGVMEFLQDLKSKNIPMCVATASDRSLTEAALKRTGALPYFQFVLTCAEIGKAKETPDIYIEAMHKMGGNTKNTVVFEDAYFSVLSAKSGGFPVVAVYDEETKKDQTAISELADGYINSFQELLNSQKNSS